MAAFRRQTRTGSNPPSPRTTNVAAPGRRICPLACYRALRGAADSAGVLGQDAALDAEGRLDPGGSAPAQLDLVDLERQRLGIRVDADAVAVQDLGDRTTDPGLRRDMADDQAMGAAG